MKIEFTDRELVIIAIVTAFASVHTETLNTVFEMGPIALDGGGQVDHITEYELDEIGNKAGQVKTTW